MSPEEKRTIIYIVLVVAFMMMVFTIALVIMCNDDPVIKETDEILKKSEVKTPTARWCHRCYRMVATEIFPHHSCRVEEGPPPSLEGLEPSTPAVLLTIEQLQIEMWLIEVVFEHLPEDGKGRSLARYDELYEAKATAKE